MIIKKYMAGTEAEAIEMAKNELGSNAVVMNIKKVKPKGLAKLFVKGKVEVTAALDETPTYEEKAEEQRTTAASSTEKETKKVKKEKEPDSSLEERLSKLQSLLEKQMTDTEEKKETKQHKEETGESESDKTPEEEGENKRTQACKDLIYHQLLDNEVDKEIADSIMEEVDRSLAKDAPLDQILANVYQKIILMLGQPYGIDVHKSDKTVFVFFLGSTGVGKTTTIAKIASKLKLEDKANIALVTADTYRIAAVEQLKTYANILSVPLKVIYSPKELGASLEELSQYDVCLIDTAGRSHKNTQQIDDIKELIEQVPIGERQVYLVLNAGVKYSDLKEIAEVYSKLTDYSLIFTKLDETSSAGAMLNIKVKTKCPLSYVTWGQNVPDDIGEMDPQRVAKKLLAGDKTN